MPLTESELSQLLLKAFEQGIASNAADAERYRWLRDQQPNSLSLCRNEGNAPNYMTVAQWVEGCMPENYTDVPADELQRMKDSNTDWALQVYPRSPVSFNVWHGATLDAVIDAARSGQEQQAQEGKES